MGRPSPAPSFDSVLCPPGVSSGLPTHDHGPGIEPPSRSFFSRDSRCSCWASSRRTGGFSTRWSGSSRRGSRTTDGACFPTCGISFPVGTGPSATRSPGRHSGFYRTLPTRSDWSRDSFAGERESRSRPKTLGPGYGGNLPQKPAPDRPAGGWFDVDSQGPVDSRPTGRPAVGATSGPASRRAMPSQGVTRPRRRSLFFRNG